jgi:hypothetical protein
MRCWTMPFMTAIQEISARIGRVTGRNGLDVIPFERSSPKSISSEAEELP